MKLRSVLFWLHLACGVVAGVVILIMSVTGVLLTYQRQITAWADTRGYRIEPAPQRLSADALLARVRRVAARSVADSRRGSIGAHGAGIAHDRRRAAAVRRSLHGRCARRGKRAGRARVLPRRRRVAPLCRGIGREPSSGPRGHRRVESRVPLHRHERPRSLWWPRSWKWPRSAISPGSRADCAARLVISTGTTRLDSGRRFRWRSSSPAVS